MAYTVKELAKLSKISVRTLHWYDEIQLLKPAYHGSNGYRYYEKKQLLILQQILFFRELGFELKQIQKILNKDDFNKVSALNFHKKALYKSMKKTQEQIKTIDKTIKHLKGLKKMEHEELYFGFDTEKQKEYQRYLINRFGDKIKDNINQSNEKIKNWSKDDFKKSQNEFGEICKDLAFLLAKKEKSISSNVQDIIEHHHEWLKKYWTPTKESYIGLGLSYLAFEWKKAFEAYDSEHPKLAQFLANAMRIFAEKNL